MNPKWLTALVCEYPVSENQLSRDAAFTVTKKENSHKSARVHLSEQKKRRQSYRAPRLQR